MYDDALAAPPAPSWHGFGQLDETVRRYAEFCVTHQDRLRQNSSGYLAREIDLIDANLERAKSSLDYAREHVALYERQVEQQGARLSVFDPEEAREQFRRLIRLPYVLGTRLERDGDLAVQLRVVHEYDGVSYDMGDFDISLSRRAVYWTRQPDNIAYDCIKNVSWRTRDPGYLGTLSDTLVLPDLCEYVEHIATQLSRPAEWHGAYYRAPAADLASAPEELWYTHLFEGQALAAARLWHENAVNAHVKDELARAERNLRDWKYEVTDRTERVRCLQAERRGRKAELQKALKREAEAPTRELDLTAAAQNVRKIASFPGVMGMRFTDDGVPVIHVRTSIVYGGDRYDMGDHEVYLREAKYERALGVVNVHATRRQMLYTHNYDDDVSASWFCVGGRADQVRNHFEKGEFPSLVHLLINTMNGVNPGSEYAVRDSFSRIPMDAVWESRLKQPRNRPRRKPRALRDAEMGRVALAGL